MPKRIDPEGSQLASVLALADVRGKRVLEIGCGDGRLTLGYAQAAASVQASDPDAESIASAGRQLPDELRDRVSYSVASAAQIEVPRCSIDLVFFSWSL
jgi:ubiquinone/menaquinone biosynthesis C-methylase UbiE